MMAQLLGQMNINYAKQNVNVKENKEDEIRTTQNQRDCQSQVNKIKGKNQPRRLVSIKSSAPRAAERKYCGNVEGKSRKDDGKC
jgi:hypothetical protein